LFRHTQSAHSGNQWSRCHGSLSGACLGQNCLLEGDQIRRRSTGTNATEEYHGINYVYGYHLLYGARHSLLDSVLPGHIGVFKHSNSLVCMPPLWIVSGRTSLPHLQRETFKLPDATSRQLLCDCCRGAHTFLQCHSPSWPGLVPTTGEMTWFMALVGSACLVSVQCPPTYVCLPACYWPNAWNHLLGISFSWLGVLTPTRTLPRA